MIISAGVMLTILEKVLNIKDGLKEVKICVAKGTFIIGNTKQEVTPCEHDVGGFWEVSRKELKTLRNLLKVIPEQPLHLSISYSGIEVINHVIKIQRYGT